jgi:hypothetical protein
VPTRSVLIALLLGACALAASPARGSWSPGGNAVCTATGDQFNAFAIPDGANGAIVAWQDRRNGSDYDIYAQRVDNLGNFMWTSDGVATCTVAGNQTNVAVCTDGAHGAIIAWEDYRYSPFDSDIYAVRLDSSGVVRAKWVANGTAVCNAAFFQGNPAIVSDGAGGAIIAWEDLRSDTLYQVFTLRLRADGTVASGWAANGVALAAANGNQYQPALASDGAGGSYVVWSDDRDPAHVSSGLFAQRITGSGASAAGWPAAGMQVCGGASSPMAAAIVADGVGGAYAAWQDLRGADFDLYAQRLRPAGTVAWAADGVPVCALTGDQTAPNLVANDQGGTIIAWNDTRSGASTARIYAQRADSLAVMGWTSGGVNLITSGGRLGAPFLASDGAGGAVMVSQAYLPDNTTDVYAQRVLATGVLPWGATTPVAVCTAAGNQQSPRPVPDGSGGAIVAWNDNRTNPTLSTYDIYAQRVLASGSVPVAGVPLATAGDFMLQPARPNPSRGATELAFTLPQAAVVTATVWDVAGRRVRDLAPGLSLEAGPHALVWDGRDEDGAPVEPGIYLARVTAGALHAEGKLVRIR